MTRRPTMNTNHITPGQIPRQPYMIEPRYTLPQYIHSHPYPVTAQQTTRLANR